MGGSEAKKTQEAGGLVPGETPQGVPSRGAKRMNVNGANYDKTTKPAPTHKATFEISQEGYNWLNGRTVEAGSESKQMGEILSKTNEPGARGIGANLIEKFNSYIKSLKIEPINPCDKKKGKYQTMEMKEIFAAYIDMKYSHSGSNPVVNKDFEYCWYDDGSAELFFRKSRDETILGWDRNCLPLDPYYSNDLYNKKPLLSNKFANLSVYDELAFNYMIFTLNSITVVHKIDKYNAINDFMKNYSFFQLTRLSNIRKIPINEVAKLKKNLFYFLLYCHPVNEETLKSFAIINDEIVHTPTNIKLKEYSIEYYRYYMDNYLEYKAELIITPDEINAVKSLNHLLINLIETGYPGIKILSAARSKLDVEFINNVDAFINLYEQKNVFLKYLEFLLNNHETDKFHDYYLSMFLQNYVTYVLRNNFHEIDFLLSFFLNIDSSCDYASLLINKIYGDATFVQHIMAEQKIEFIDIKFITDLFNPSTREMYRIL
ncbi:hypothetical protein S483_004645 [Salmonella enterica subsp. salamae]|nr:hypothetical protein [Salmonella enterica subsp. salamae]